MLQKEKPCVLQLFPPVLAGMEAAFATPFRVEYKLIGG